MKENGECVGTEILDYIDSLKGDEGQMFLTAKMLLPLVKLPREEHG